MEAAHNKSAGKLGFSSEDLFDQSLPPSLLLSDSVLDLPPSDKTFELVSPTKPTGGTELSTLQTTSVERRGKPKVPPRGRNISETTLLEADTLAEFEDEDENEGNEGLDESNDFDLEEEDENEPSEDYVGGSYQESEREEIAEDWNPYEPEAEELEGDLSEPSQSTPSYFSGGSHYNGQYPTLVPFSQEGYPVTDPRRLVDISFPSTMGSTRRELFNANMSTFSSGSSYPESPSYAIGNYTGHTLSPGAMSEHTATRTVTSPSESDIKQAPVLCQQETVQDEDATETTLVLLAPIPSPARDEAKSEVESTMAATVKAFDSQWDAASASRGGVKKKGDNEPLVSASASVARPNAYQATSPTTESASKESPPRKLDGIQEASSAVPSAQTRLLVDIQALLKQSSQLALQAQGHVQTLLNSDPSVQEMQKNADLSFLEGKVAELQKQIATLAKSRQSPTRGLSPIPKQNLAVSGLQLKVQATKIAFKESQDAFRCKYRATVDFFGDAIQSLSQFGASPKPQVDLKTLHQMTTLYQSEHQERVRLHNLLQELRGDIRVAVRVRPLLPQDQPPTTTSSLKGQIDWVEAEPGILPAARSATHLRMTAKHGNVRGTASAMRRYSFTFDRVFDHRSTQAEVVEMVLPMATSVMDGYHCCVLAYGQTGSGKTHTMLGTQTEPGVMFCLLDAIWSRKQFLEAHHHTFTYAISVSVLEIYNENVYDLLRPPSEIREKRLEIRQGAGGPGGEVTVSDLTELGVTNGMTEIVPILLTGMRNRAVGVSNMNLHSSRSHCIVRVRVRGLNQMTQERTDAMLFMVDLAGSERLSTVALRSKQSSPSSYSSFASFSSSSHSNALRFDPSDKPSASQNPADLRFAHLRETQHINRSLTALGDVMEALARMTLPSGPEAITTTTTTTRRISSSSSASANTMTTSSFIPYRNSKLTFLLQNALGRGSKVLMIAAVTPTRVCAQETMCTLNFATRVSRVRLGEANRRASPLQQQQTESCEQHD